MYNRVTQQIFYLSTPNWLLHRPQIKYSLHSLNEDARWCTGLYLLYSQTALTWTRFCTRMPRPHRKWCPSSVKGQVPCCHRKWNVLRWRKFKRQLVAGSDNVLPRCRVKHHVITGSDNELCPHKVEHQVVTGSDNVLCWRRRPDVAAGDVCHG